MSTRAVAKKLIRLCRERRHCAAVEELYADRCTSREMPGVEDEFLVGKQAIAKKNQRWFEMVYEFHRGEVSDPIIAGDYFSCKMSLDVTFKGHHRMQLVELCVYRVKNDQIVSEQFFYSGPP